MQRWIVYLMQYLGAVLPLKTLTGPMWAVTAKEHAAKLASVLAMAVQLTDKTEKYNFKCAAMTAYKESKQYMYTWFGYNDLPLPSEETKAVLVRWR